MSLKSLGLALAAGITAFLVVGVAVTDLAQPWNEFSLFLGIPAGIVAAYTAAVVYLGLADDTPGRRHCFAGTFAAFGVASLAALVVLAGLVDLGLALALVLPSGIALVATAVAYIRGPNRKPTDSGNDGDRPCSPN